MLTGEMVSPWSQLDLLSRKSTDHFRLKIFPSVHNIHTAKLFIHDSRRQRPPFGPPSKLTDFLLQVFNTANQWSSLEHVPHWVDGSPKSLWIKLQDSLLWLAFWSPEWPVMPATRCPLGDSWCLLLDVPGGTHKWCPLLDVLWVTMMPASRCSLVTQDTHYCSLGRYDVSCYLIPLGGPRYPLLGFDAHYLMSPG